MVDHITMDYNMLAGVVGWLVLALAGGIAWGRVVETLKKHSDILRECHPDEVRTKAECDAKIKVVRRRVAGVGIVSENRTHRARYRGNKKRLEKENGNGCERPDQSGGDHQPH